ncbi:hypothetical protein KP77_24990 [Jeotgalibacillus alimentarius]|uniref:Uncharacterized protein n=1 Tax=Jeotgalibacillus alimentarius TaxID=135826 RepID=A0A0C2R9C4_9BACL|nr:hypothetical protein [Jeotgalibacillus alimentarius]KIL46930.1 hypothetical protein KP77_24990 [Jeotgalibacillus alimentarius]
MLEKKRDEDISHQIEAITRMIATNNRSMRDEEFTKYFNDLQRLNHSTKNQKPQNMKFDREGMERLRAMQGG